MSSISIIIPTLNEEQYIAPLIQSLNNQTTKPKEIIIVDGNSVDNTQKKVKQFTNVRLLITKKNPALQRSAGGRAARGDLLVFLDADVFPQADFLEKITKLYKKKHFNIGCPYYLGHPGALTISTIYVIFDILFFLFQKILPSGAGSCIIVEKKVFDSVHGFNQVYTYDDIEFIRRVSQQYRFIMLPLVLKVSDRRFRKLGTARMFLQYLLLSIFFIFNQFKAANIIPYAFEKKNRSIYR